MKLGLAPSPLAPLALGLLSLNLLIRASALSPQDAQDVEAPSSAGLDPEFENSRWRRGGEIRMWDGQLMFDDDVAVLNGRNFHSIIRKAPHVLVEFYAPWCGHCQKFEPIYQRAASHLRMEEVNVMLAKVDAMENQQLTKEMGVAGFPDLRWFAYGSERDYEGGRHNDSLVEWVTYHSRRDAVFFASNTREAEDYLESINATEAVIGRFLDKFSIECKTFLTVAEEDAIRDTNNKTIPYVMVLESHGLGVPKLGSKESEAMSDTEVYGPAIGPSVLVRKSRDAGGGLVAYGRWYKPPLWHLTSPEIRYSMYNPARLKAFIGTYRMPTVVPLGPKTWSKVLDSPVRNQTLLFSDPDTEGHEERLAAFTKIADESFGKILFLHITSKLGNVLGYFGMSKEDFPAVVVAVAGSDETKKGEMFRLDQSDPHKNLQTIVKEGKTGQVCREDQTCSDDGDSIRKMADVIRNFTSVAFEGKEPEFVLPEQNLDEDVIYPDDPVRKLTATNFMDVVMDPSRDVLVKFYAPWCGHCKAMKTAYMQLCDRFEDQPSIVIAEFDATAHKMPSGIQIEGYPTIRFFPADRSNSSATQKKTIDFTGRRELDDLTTFVESHAISLQILKEMEAKAEEMEKQEKELIEKGDQSKANELRTEIDNIRKTLAGSALATTGEKKEKNRQPIYSKRILMDALRKSEEAKQKSIGG